MCEAKTLNNCIILLGRLLAFFLYIAGYSREWRLMGFLFTHLANLKREIVPENGITAPLFGTIFLRDLMSGDLFYFRILISFV